MNVVWSASHFLASSCFPGLIVHARDDPFIPHEPFERAHRPANLSLELVDHGGHLGYLSRRPWDGDRRWLDARLTDSSCPASFRRPSIVLVQRVAGGLG